MLAKEIETRRCAVVENVLSFVKALQLTKIPSLVALPANIVQSSMKTRKHAALTLMSLAIKLTHVLVSVQKYVLSELKNLYSLLLS